MEHPEISSKGGKEKFESSLEGIMEEILKLLSCSTIPSPGC